MNQPAAVAYPARSPRTVSADSRRLAPLTKTFGDALVLEAQEHIREEGDVPQRLARYCLRRQEQLKHEASLKAVSVPTVATIPTPAREPVTEAQVVIMAQEAGANATMWRSLSCLKEWRAQYWNPMQKAHRILHGANPKRLRKAMIFADE